MIYVPMLKTRAEELKVAKEMNFCFSDKDFIEYRRVAREVTEATNQFSI